MLTAFYDLARCPVSYDFVSFLLAVEAERRRTGQDAVQIVFLKGPVAGFRQDGFWPPIEERDDVFADVVAPMAKMLPSVTEVIGPTSDPVLAPPPLFGAQGPAPYGLRTFVEAWREVGPVLHTAGRDDRDNTITMTLREAEHWPERNSNVDAWYEAAARLQDRGHTVHVIPDTRLVSQSSDLTAVNAATHIYCRAALYLSADVNLFVNNGPAWLSFALGAPTVMLRPTCQAIGGTASASYLASCGIPTLGQLPKSDWRQRIVWENDDADTIVRAALSFLKDRPHVAA